MKIDDVRRTILSTAKQDLTSHDIFKRVSNSYSGKLMSSSTAFCHTCHAIIPL
jgi:hypothetical protein